jgi:hypothetical protein
LPLASESGINYISIIIGYKAKNLREMEDKSGCRITVKGPSIKSKYFANNESEEK